MHPGIKGRHVFLTGAAGFIGSRLAECLSGAYGVEIHALVRRVGTAGTARLARLSGVKIFSGDVRDAGVVREAARGCSYFIHCVTGTRGTYREQREEEITGTGNVLDAAVREGAERVVYFSSAAVHDPAQSGDKIREVDPLNGNVLGWRKILGEALVSECQERDRVPTVILRPTCVWGPFSPTWAISAAELILKGIPVLPAGCRGKANAVYIDNLVDAVYLALTRPEAVGEVFLINDDEPESWGELYGGYAQCLGAPLRFISHASSTRDLWRVSFHNAGFVLKNVIARRTGWGMDLMRQVYEHVPVVKIGVSMLPEPIQWRLRRYAADEGVSASADSGCTGFLPYGWVSRSIRDLYESRGRYSSEKAKRVLGWTPRVSFQAAMDLTCQWLKYAGYTN